MPYRTPSTHIYALGFCLNCSNCARLKIGSAGSDYERVVRIERQGCHEPECLRWIFTGVDTQRHENAIHAWLKSTGLKVENKRGKEYYFFPNDGTREIVLSWIDDYAKQIANNQV